MHTRKLQHEESFSAPPERVFALLHTPSAIRSWWGAARAIVHPEEGGIWVATWGSNEDAPDYISAARIQSFEPPRRMLMSEILYYDRSGPLPFKAELTTEFNVAPHPSGATLHVIQDGFPSDKIADIFHAACERGWRATFAGIRKYLEQQA